MFFFIISIILNILLVVLLIGIAYGWMQTEPSMGENIEYNRDFYITDSDIDVSEKSSVKNILSYADLFMKNGDNPFGNANLNSLDDVFARFCVRAFATMATQAYSDINSVTLGKLDAETFYELFGNNSNIGKLRDGLANVTSDKIYEFVKNGTKETRLDANAKSNPWYAMNHLLSTGDEKHCYLAVGMFSDDSCVIPLKNLSWKEWNGV